MSIMGSSGWPAPAGGGGGGSITEITSIDGSVVVTDPMGPVVDLSVTGNPPVSAVLPADVNVLANTVVTLITGIQLVPGVQYTVSGALLTGNTGSTFIVLDANGNSVAQGSDGASLNSTSMSTVITGKVFTVPAGTGLYRLICDNANNPNENNILAESQEPVVPVPDASVINFIPAGLTTPAGLATPTALAIASYGPNGGATPALPTVLGPIDAVNLHTGPFTVPASGNYQVELTARVVGNNAAGLGPFCSFALTDHGGVTQRGPTRWASQQAGSIGSNIGLMVVVPIIVVGDVPGATRDLDWSAIASGADWVLGLDDGSLSPFQGPATMIVTAL